MARNTPVSEKFKSIGRSLGLNKLYHVFVPIPPSPAYRPDPHAQENAARLESKKKLKVALCFSGQMRNVARGYKYIKKNILEPNADRCEIDLFVHTFFDQSEVDKVFFASNGTKITTPITAQSIADVYTCYNPKKILIEKPIQFDEKNYAEHKSEKIVPLFTLRKNYSIKRAFELRKEYEAANNFTYDFVVNLRFDLGVQRPIVFENCNPEVVTVSELGVTDGRGLDVGHAIMGSHLADTYGVFFDYIDQYYNEGTKFCDEILMHRHLESKNVPIYRTAALNEYILIR